MLSIYVYANSPWESITIRRSVSLHFNWWISHRLKQEEVKSQHVCTDFFKSLYLKILWIQIIFFSVLCMFNIILPVLKYNFINGLSKKHSGLTVFFIYSNIVLYPYATECSLFGWHTLVEAKYDSKLAPGLRPAAGVNWCYNRRCNEEDRNNLLRSQTPLMITYRPQVEFCHGDFVRPHTQGFVGPSDDSPLFLKNFQW